MSMSGHRSAILMKTQPGCRGGVATCMAVLSSCDEAAGFSPRFRPSADRPLVDSRATTPSLPCLAVRQARVPLRLGEGLRTMVRN